MHDRSNDQGEHAWFVEEKKKGKGKVRTHVIDQSRQPITSGAPRTTDNYELRPQLHVPSSQYSNRKITTVLTQPPPSFLAP